MRWLLILALLLQVEKPKLVTRVFPPVQIADLGVGCGEVIFTAEIKGPEDERWYCPKVIWEQTNGMLIGSEEADCPPFEQRDSCYPPQGPECGWKGFRLNPITGQYEDYGKDCPCTVIGYKRIWRRTECVPAHPNGEQWIIVVRFEKNGKTLARDEIRFLIK